MVAESLSEMFICLQMSLNILLPSYPFILPPNSPQPVMYTVLLSTGSGKTLAIILPLFIHMLGTGS